MSLNDLAIIINSKSFAENKVILTVLTQNHGIYKAMSAKSSKNQLGSLIQFYWRSKQSDALGFAKCELIESYCTYFLFSKIKLYAFNSIIYLINNLFLEKEENKILFQKTHQFIQEFKTQATFSFINYIEFELFLLKISGYGLDLTRCAVSQTKDNLCYLSPKSGCAISKDIGLIYHKQLFLLPEFLVKGTEPLSYEEFSLSTKITSYFFMKYLMPNECKNIHSPRNRFLAWNFFI